MRRSYFDEEFEVETFIEQIRTILNSLPPSCLSRLRYREVFCAGRGRFEQVYSLAKIVNPSFLPESDLSV